MAVSALEEGRLYALGYGNVAGVDESGMGTYVGDVYVSAVILPKDIDAPCDWRSPSSETPTIRSRPVRQPP